MDTSRFKDRTAIVTGGASGIGLAMAQRFAAEGAAVEILDLTEGLLDEAAKSIRNAGGDAHSSLCDVSDSAAVEDTMVGIHNRRGRIDVLVNNAGNAGPTSGLDDLVPFWESDPSEWRRWMATNFDGVLNCTRHAMSGMAETGYGRIVTVISDAGRVGEPHLAVYSGAKAGAAGFMRAIAKLSLIHI